MIKFPYYSVELLKGPILNLNVEEFKIDEKELLYARDCALNFIEIIERHAIENTKLDSPNSMSTIEEDLLNESTIFSMYVYLNINEQEKNCIYSEDTKSVIYALSKEAKFLLNNKFITEDDIVKVNIAEKYKNKEAFTIKMEDSFVSYGFQHNEFKVYNNRLTDILSNFMYDDKQLNFCEEKLLVGSH